MSVFNEQLTNNINKIRTFKPLVHNITNYVVMNVTANALLATGASPVMAHAREEVCDMVSMAGSLVVNIGTLSPLWIEAMIQASQKASEQNIPIVLDPVGSGATDFRTSTAKSIIKNANVSVIRGNASEILSLQDSSSTTKGVDSLHSVDEVATTAQDLARELQTTLAITGETDLVTNGEQTVRISNGHSLMPLITGSGCTATAIIGAFLAVDSNPLTATSTALAFFGVAGEIAADAADAPGSFQVALLDALYKLTPEELVKRAQIKEV